MTDEKISSFFERDHAEIDAVLESVPFAKPKEAAARFAEFDRRLERHIEWEESILFPAVAEKAPELEGGPLAVMRQEHKEIRAAKAAAQAALKEGDGPQARRDTDAMLSVLKPHNRKEEQILYPACDELLDDGERRAVLERVRGTVAR